MGFFIFATDSEKNVKFHNLCSSSSQGLMTVSVKD